jgi:hypothetical protein
VSQLDDLDRVHCETRAHWRAWLQRHHGGATGIWLVTWRKSSGRPVLAYDDMVEEALAFGWVDSKGGKVDEQRTRLLFTPRKRGSSWSRPNKLRIAKLEAAGLMTPAGRTAVDAAKADGSWTRLDGGSSSGSSPPRSPTPGRTGSRKPPGLPLVGSGPTSGHARNARQSNVRARRWVASASSLVVRRALER